METQDEFQILIKDAKKKISQEILQAIDSVNWKLTILEMAGKYNQDQLDALEIETELLLCGILSPEVYQKELENRMMLTEGQVNLLLEEMDKLIFKKIQSELEKKISSMQKVVSSKEDKIINNEELIIKNEKKVVEEDEVPKPPYAESITNYELRINNENTSSKKEGTKITNDELRITNETPKEMPITPVKPVQEVRSDVFEDKLKGSVSGGNNVSEYSSKTPDPYREAF